MEAKLLSVTRYVRLIFAYQEEIVLSIQVTKKYFRLNEVISLSCFEISKNIR